MRIAQVAPLYESVPPANYGGTERVVSYLTEELVRRNQHVTLFASGDSVTQAQLIPCSSQALRTDKNCVDPIAAHFTMLEKVLQRAKEFDLIHFHVDYLHFPFSRHMHCPHVTTLHGRLDIPELPALYEEFTDMPVVSISDDQRQPLQHAHWQGTVYHGLPEALHSFREQHGKYLAFLGRLSIEKRADRAIMIAKQTGMKLKIAAKIDDSDQAYFDKELRHLLDDPLVEFIGEVGGAEKDDFLGNAYALLFPIDWPEPFGLVMIEAMACGTPVIAWRNGSVPEVIEQGVTGFIVDDMDQAVKAVHEIPSLSRQRCRQAFLDRFTASRMTNDYLAIYRQLVNSDPSPRLKQVATPSLREASYQTADPQF